MLLSGREEKPMFEVIYISPSCKQAERFIIDLAEKLKSLGIDDFELEQKNLRLKTGNVIVSAIDIWGGQLGQNHQITKYYIDDIPAQKFIGKEIIERFCYLKSIFKEGTQEIYEDDLIELLKEG